MSYKSPGEFQIRSKTDFQLYRTGGAVVHTQVKDKALVVCKNADGKRL